MRAGANLFTVASPKVSFHKPPVTGRVGNGFTSVPDGDGSNDCNGHGTHVAGTSGYYMWQVYSYSGSDRYGVRARCI